MKTTLTISVHSFVDLITNSSSEVYVTANKKTVKVVKSIIELFLKNAGIERDVGELFTIELVYTGYDGETDEEADMIGESDYAPSRIRITQKTDSGEDLKKLSDVLNKLNGAFEGKDFCC